jgi:hypothetical protein
VRQLFLLSPAKVSGARAGYLLNPEAQFPTARAFQREGLPLGEVFAFASGLYFRGKLTYARHFVVPTNGDEIRVITTNRGLLSPDARIGPDDLRAFGSVNIDGEDPRYLDPIRNHGQKLARELDGDGVAILLGSIATAKYRDVLLECFGDRLLFPAEFVGRGDMSRGGLLLRCTRENSPLHYTSVQGAILRGRRAPRISEMK